MTGRPAREIGAMAWRASSSVSPATNRRAKPCRAPRRAIQRVTAFFVESQKIRSRSGFVVFAFYWACIENLTERARMAYPALLRAKFGRTRVPYDLGEC